MGSLPIRFLMLILPVALSATAVATDQSRTVLTGNTREQVDFREGTPRMQDLPGGKKTLRFDAPFNFRVDLKSQNVEPQRFDLMMLRVKADPAARLRIALENHPRVGDISYSYVLDSMQGPFDWQTIWVGLRLPEEIKTGDDTRSPWRAGRNVWR